MTDRPGGAKAALRRPPPPHDDTPAALRDPAAPAGALEDRTP